MTRPCGGTVFSRATAVLAVATLVGAPALARSAPPVGGEALVAQPGDACGGLVFGNHRDLPVPALGTIDADQALAVGDFDADGRVDLAVAGGSTGVVVVLRGTGGGAFAPFVTVPVGAATATGIVAADFDADGRLDLAATSFGNGTVSLLLRTPDGGWKPPLMYALPDTPTALAAVDLTGDGWLDLAVTSGTPDLLPQPGWLSVLPNAGGAFGARADYLVGGVYPHAIAAADLDGDDDQDLAVGVELSDRVAVFLNDGSGALAAATPVVMSGPRSVALGDINGDGSPDLVAAGRDDGLWLAPGSGDGAFAASTRLPLPLRPIAVALADFDGDSHLDAAVAHSGQVLDVTGLISVLRGDGAGSFAAPAPFVTSANPIALVAADLDGDGGIDVATVSRAERLVSVLIGGRCEPGGADFRVGDAPTGIALVWTTGFAQSGYLVARLAGGTTTLLPSPTSPLPASTTEFVDTEATAGVLACYLLLPLGSGGVLGRSELLCIVPASRAGFEPFRGMTARLSQGGVAHLTWDRPGGGSGFQTAFTLLALPLDGSPPRATTLFSTGVVRADDETGGVATCYLLLRRWYQVITGTSDMVCVVPGVAQLGEAGRTALAASRPDQTFIPSRFLAAALARPIVP
jgi:hypothetical protein